MQRHDVPSTRRPGLKYMHSTVVFGLDIMLSNNIPRHLAAYEPHKKIPILFLSPETDMIQGNAVGSNKMKFVAVQHSDPRLIWNPA